MPREAPRGPLEAALAEVVRDEIADDLVELRAALEELRARLEHAGDAERALDRRGLAQWLGCSVRTVDALIADGMPIVRLGGPGGSPRMMPSEVWAWLRARGVDRGQLVAIDGGRR